MNAAEHHREAERLLALAYRDGHKTALLQLAQVHATLANSVHGQSEGKAWREVHFPPQDGASDAGFELGIKSDTRRDA